MQHNSTMHLARMQSVASHTCYCAEFSLCLATWFSRTLCICHTEHTHLLTNATSAATLSQLLRSPAMVPASSSDFLATSRSPPTRSARSTGSILKAAAMGDSRPCRVQTGRTIAGTGQLSIHETLVNSTLFQQEGATKEEVHTQTTSGGFPSRPEGYTFLFA
jgi:hypothetical protein